MLVNTRTSMKNVIFVKKRILWDLVHQPVNVDAVRGHVAASVLSFQEKNQVS